MILAFCTIQIAIAQQKVSILTTKGEIIIELYDETPKHRDNFIKLVKSGFYDSTLFHRVINSFMIQGGDPESVGAPQNERLGMGGPGYQIDAEFNEKFIHKKGALAAARRGGPSNPKKKSSGSQFYIVQGKLTPSNLLTRFEQNRTVKYTKKQKELYETIGGTPNLDGEYTVFGEVVKGLEVVDLIAAVQTNQADRPVKDVIILSMKLLGS